MMNKILTIAVLTALTPVLVLADGMHDDEAMAYGEPGTAVQVNRVINVQAADNMRYTPAAITVRRGETIEFVVKNTGKLAHEFVLGDAKELKEHAALMRRYPNMEHDDPNMAKLTPGGTANLIWKFTRAGTVEFACLVPGHYEAGMKGHIRVNTK
ncbi:MAG: plastocyanin/azurin family copper-binding protein [Bacteroidota bacterium]